MRSEPLIGMIGIGFTSRLPMYRHLALFAGGQPLWPWRSAMMQHNKRLKRGRFRRTMRGRSKRRSKPVEE